MARADSPETGIDQARLSLRRPGGTRLWRAAKLALPTVATVAILLLIFWSQSNLKETRFRIGVTELAPEEIDELKMLNLRFDGMDDENRPFSITADIASQNTDLEGVIDLVEPRADITLSDGAWVALMAGSGHYDRAGDRLDLAGGVNVFHDRGFEMSTDVARVDLDTGTATSDTETHGQGPAGYLTASGFRLESDGDRVMLTGPAQLHLYAAGETDASTDDSDAGQTDASDSDTTDGATTDDGTSAQ